MRYMRKVRPRIQYMDANALGGKTGTPTTRYLSKASTHALAGHTYHNPITGSASGFATRATKLKNTTARGTAPAYAELANIV